MLRAEILSPVHIGDGERLTKHDFVFRRRMVFALNMKKFFEENRKRAQEYYEKASNDVSLENFLTQKEAEKYSAYRIKSSERPRDVLTFIKNPVSEVYLPGSSLKGAIRTALIFYAFKRAENGEKVERIISRESNPKKVGRQIERLFFACGYKKGKRVFYDDAKFDLLKFLSITDSSFLPAEECLEVYKVNTFSKNRKGALIPKRFSIFLEALKPGSVLEFDMRVDDEFIRRAEEIETENRWIGLSEKLERLFGGNVFKNPEGRVVNAVEEACREFSSKIIERELEFLKGSGFYEIEEFYSGIMSDETLLRLGYGTGWHSHTIGLLLGKEVVKWVRRKFKLGRAGVPEFPKTRKFAMRLNRAVYPLGWVRVTKPQGAGRWCAGKNFS